MTVRQARRRLETMNRSKRKDKFMSTCLIHMTFGEYTVALGLLGSGTLILRLQALELFLQLCSRTDLEFV